MFSDYINCISTKYTRYFVMRKMNRSSCSMWSSKTNSISSEAQLHIYVCVYHCLYIYRKIFFVTKWSISLSHSVGQEIVCPTSFSFWCSTDFNPICSLKQCYWGLKCFSVAVQKIEKMNKKLTMSVLEKIFVFWSPLILHDRVSEPLPVKI